MPRIFAEQGWLWLLVLLGVVALLVRRGSSRRRAEWEALGLVGPPPPNGVWFWWVAGYWLILALAGPRWGRQPGSEPPPGHDLVFLVDVSRSMGAEDAVPDRLRLATDAARSLVAQLRTEPGDRAALVAFAGRAAIRCPLTASLDSVVDRLDELRPGSVEPGGTDLGAGLAVALDLFDTEHADGRSIVIFSDGEDHAGTWPSTVESLVNARIPVHVVAVGDPDHSTPVPSSGDLAKSTNTTEPPPMTRRNDAALTQLAYATGGAVIPLGLAPTDLGPLYRDAIRPTTRSRRPPPRFSERAERSSVCLAVALAAGVWGTWPRSRRRSFRSDLLVAGRSYPWGRILVVTMIALMLVLISLAATPVSPDAAAEAATTRGTAAYRAGQFTEALTAFEAALAISPKNPIGPFDAGAALFALERYPEATIRYEIAHALATTGGRTGLLVKINYALGNCLAMMGDFAGAVLHYDECLAATDRRSDLIAVRQDATVNREFALTQMTPPPDRPARDDLREDQPDDSANGHGQRSDPHEDPATQGDGFATDNQSPSGSNSSSTGKRGPGGAGGGGAALPESDSPERRLEAALRRIRAAQEKRPDQPKQPSRPAQGLNRGKDW